MCDLPGTAFGQTENIHSCLTFQVTELSDTLNKSAGTDSRICSSGGFSGCSHAFCVLPDRTVLTVVLMPSVYCLTGRFEQLFSCLLYLA